MTESADGLSLEMITAALRADSADVAVYARVLEKVTVRLGDRVMSLQVQPGRPPAAEICREVRGIVLSRQPVTLQEWVDELARALAAHAQQNAHAAEVLRKLVAGS